MFFNILWIHLFKLNTWLIHGSVRQKSFLWVWIYDEYTLPRLDFMNTWFIHSCVRQNVSLWVWIYNEYTYLDWKYMNTWFIHGRIRQKNIFYEFDLKWIHLSSYLHWIICIYMWLIHDNIRQNISWYKFEYKIITLTNIRFIWTHDLYMTAFDKTYISMSLNIQLIHLFILDIYEHEIYTRPHSTKHIFLWVWFKINTLR